MSLEKDKELDLINYEDIQHLSKLWSKDGLANAEIRNSSHIVRRMLLYRDILKSSTPRKLKLKIIAPDNKPINKAIEQGFVEFFQSAGTAIHGIEMRAFMRHRESPRLRAILSELNPDRTVEVRLESFLNQPVFYYKGQSISREQVISYVANKTGGPHFDRNRENEFATLDLIRTAYSVGIEEGTPSIYWNLPAQETPLSVFIPSQKEIDPVYIEFAAACRLFSESPSIRVLFEMIGKDLGLGLEKLGSGQV